MNCPPRERLLSHALGHEHPAVATHLSGCSRCGEEVAAVRRAASQLRAAARSRSEVTPQCLDELAVARFVDGATDGAERAAIVSHLLSCAGCRSSVAGVGRLVADAALMGEAPMTAPSRRRLAWPIPVAAAAAAVLLVLVWPRGPDDTGSLHRAPVTASPVPVPLSPAGPVAEVRRLSWTAIAGANRYRATLFDAEGRVLYETQLLDTVAMLPDSVTFVSGRPYLWKVEARTGWDRWSGSELVEFSIASGGVR